MSYAIDYFTPNAENTFNECLRIYGEVHGNKVGNGIDENFILSPTLEEKPNGRGYIVSEDAINYVKGKIIEMRMEGFEVYT